MTRSEFINEFAEMLDVKPDALQPQTEMKDLETWDSVAYLSAMVLIDEKLGITVQPEVFANARIFEDILSAIGFSAQE